MLPPPTFSVMIPTYNCAEFLKETLTSVLDSGFDLEHMQIEVIDDCSTKDDPEGVVKKFGRGKVAFFRQPQNVGISRNFNTCIERAKGLLVHILHGDDTVMPGFYDEINRLAEQFPERGFFFTRCTTIDAKGQVIGSTCTEVEDLVIGAVDKRRSYLSNRLAFPGVVVRKLLYDRVGSLRTDLWGEADVEFPRMVFRKMLGQREMVFIAGLMRTSMG